MSTSPAGAAHRAVAPPTDPPAWCRPNTWPFRLHSTEVDGNEIVYTDEGPPGNRRPTLVFVHTGMWSFVFRDVITRLRNDFRCVTIDGPGHGLSPEPQERYLTLTEHSRILGRFLDEQRLGDVVLVLHDLGGPVGIGSIAEQTERVRGLVLSNTFLWRPDRRSLRSMLRIVSSRPMTGIDRATGFIPRVSSGKNGIGLHLDEASKQTFVAGMRQPGQTARFHRLMRDALGSDELYERVERTTTEKLRDRPVLTIFGEKNDPFGFQRRHHETFPNHQGHVIPGGNHFPMMDDPDFFAATLAEWVGREVETTADG